MATGTATTTARNGDGDWASWRSPGPGGGGVSDAARRLERDAGVQAGTLGASVQGFAAGVLLVVVLVLTAVFAGGCSGMHASTASSVETSDGSVAELLRLGGPQVTKNVMTTSDRTWSATAELDPHVVSIGTEGMDFQGAGRARTAGLTLPDGTTLFFASHSDLGIARLEITHPDGSSTRVEGLSSRVTEIAEAEAERVLGQFAALAELSDDQRAVAIEQTRALVELGMPFADALARSIDLLGVVVPVAVPGGVTP